MKIIILGGTLKSANLGVCALTSGAVKVIRNCFPGSEIIIMDYAHQPDNFKLYVDGEYVDVKLVNIRFSKKIYLDNNIAKLIFFAILAKVLRFKWFKDYIYRNNIYLRLVSDSDFVVSIAGGDSFSDIYGVGRYLYVFLPQLLSVLMNKDIFHVPQTFGPFRRSYVRASAKCILKHSKYVYSREYRGVEEIKRLISPQRGDQKIGFCYDFGFVLDPISPRKLGIEGQLMDFKNLIGFNISGLLYIGGYTGKNMFYLKIDYNKFVEDLIECLINKKLFKVILIPHVLGGRENVESDWIVCEHIFQKLKDKYPGKLFFAGGKYNQNEIKYLIGRTEFFMGSRMHACIAALSQNIPAVAIAYSDKFAGVLKSIGMEDLVADPRKLDEIHLLLKIESALEKRDVYRRKLEELMPYVKGTVLNAFRQVC